MMGTFDFTPLFRNTIGFDHLFDMANTVTREPTQSYPPYNIEKLGEHSYQITMAVAGFNPDNIDIELQENVLSITGNIKKTETARQFLYHGIGERAFQRKFSLADYMHVVDAKMEHGLLHVKLEREIPDEAKPRKIKISSTQQTAISK